MWQAEYFAGTAAIPAESPLRGNLSIVPVLDKGEAGASTDSRMRVQPTGPDWLIFGIFDARSTKQALQEFRGR